MSVTTNVPSSLVRNKGRNLDVFGELGLTENANIRLKLLKHATLYEVLLAVVVEALDV